MSVKASVHWCATRRALDLTHEFYHFLEDNGVISNADKVFLNNKICCPDRQRSPAIGRLKGRSNAEAGRNGWAGPWQECYDAKTLPVKSSKKSRTSSTGSSMPGYPHGFRGDPGHPDGAGMGGDKGRRKGAAKQLRHGYEDAAVTVEEHIRYALAEEAERAWEEKVAAPAARKVSQGVASLIGNGARGPERLAGWENFKRHWQEFWQPFSTLKGGEKALAARYRAMGNVAQATRFIEGLYQKLETFPDDVKRDMFWYLDGQVPLDILPQEAQTMAQTIKARIETIGEMLVDRGIISEETFQAHRGKYVHYLYAKHILGEDAPIFLSSTGKLNLTYTKQRNPNLTLQAAQGTGALIEDASVAVPSGWARP
jgi:hypothetical protein